MKKLIVIDGNSLANRAFYAIPVLNNSQGVPTNAVYGFTNMLMTLINQEKPDYLAVAFDVHRQVFRHEKYADYKAQRKSTPVELREQMGLIKEVLAAMNIPIYQMEGYEGDDVIGTMVRWAEKEGIYSIIVTGDKDTLQLITENTAVYLTKRGISELARYDLAAFREEYQLEPDQIRDLKGLMGDTSDNIPGVQGVGEKTAMNLLRDYHTVEGVYENLADFKGKKLGEKLEKDKENAFLSKELATIYCEVPLTFEHEALLRQEADVPQLVEVYQRLELKNLLRNLLASQEKTEEFNTQAAITEAKNLPFEIMMLIDEEEEAEENGELEELPLAAHGEEVFELERVKEILDECKGKIDDMVIVLDTATENHLAEKVNAYGLLVNRKPYLVYCNNTFSEHAALLKPFLEDKDILILTDDAKKLFTYCLRENIAVESLYWDSKLMAYLLDPEAKDLSVDRLLLESYDIVLDTDPVEHMYGVLKGIYILSNYLVDLLEEDGMLELYAQVELPLAEILAKMEYNGIKVDRAYLERTGKELDAQIEELKQSLYQAAGEEFNINSSKQLGQILFEKMGMPVIKKTKTGYSTDSEVLETLAADYEFVNDILRYRQLTKLKSTYIEGIIKLLEPGTDKVHTTFNQTITATGRLSSTEPNLQNIPIRTEEGKKIRKAFLPTKPGNILISADYSQIELRILAHMSQDPVLLSSFIENEDIHARTASEVFNVPLEEVTKEQRRSAKAVNFGIIYGQTDFGLAKELGIGRSEAKGYIEHYFATYSGVKNWIDKVIAETKQDEYTTTLLGRRRYISNINSSNFRSRSFAERTAVNSPIQGTAADIIKIAMVKIDHELKAHGFTAKMLLQVHDELIFEAPPQEVAALIVVIRECMERSIKLDVPLQVDINAGFNWHDMERV